MGTLTGYVFNRPGSLSEVWLPYTICKWIFSPFFFFFLATPTAYRSSQARNQIQAAAVTYGTAVAMPDP